MSSRSISVAKDFELKRTNPLIQSTRSLQEINKYPEYELLNRAGGIVNSLRMGPSVRQKLYLRILHVRMKRDLSNNLEV
jgi:hypothetical protein